MDTQTNPKPPNVIKRVSVNSAGTARVEVYHLDPLTLVDDRDFDNEADADAFAASYVPAGFEQNLEVETGSNEALEPETETVDIEAETETVDTPKVEPEIEPIAEVEDEPLPEDPSDDNEHESDTDDDSDDDSEVEYDEDGTPVYKYD